MRLNPTVKSFVVRLQELIELLYRLPPAS